MDWREIGFLDEMDECLVRVKGIEGTLLAISEADSEIGRETLVLLHWVANEARERLEKALSLAGVCGARDATGSYGAGKNVGPVLRRRLTIYRRHVSLRKAERQVS